MSWISALKIVPWSDVVAAAPTLARGAQQLWTKVRSAPPVAEHAEATPAAGTDAPDAPDALSAIVQRVAQLEDRLDEHRRAAVTASELIATLADQNAQLVEAVARLNARTRLLFGIATALALGLLVTAAWLAFAAR